jgi:Tfp pilus assembly protein FimT
MRRIAIVLLVVLALGAVLGWFAAPYGRAASLLARVANAGGRIGEMPTLAPTP